jgi:triacylglycerol esterase/lipase EstA (alpha/beta hydrolase family)
MNSIKKIPKQIFLFLKTLITTVVFSLLTMGSFIRGLRRKQVRILPQNISCINPKQNNYVILIHGRGDDGGQFNSITNVIRNSTDLNYILIALDQKDNLIKDDIVRVRNQIITSLENILHAHSKLNVTVVGISKGGVTAASLIANHCDPRITYRKLITIASPLHGTTLANYGFGTNARVDLSYKNAYVLRVKSELSVLAAKTDLKTYHIVNKFDNTILPSSTSAYDFPSSTAFVHKSLTSHIAIQDNPEVVAKVMDWICE